VTGRLQGKRALITGGGSGIGLAIAQRFAQEGAAVSVADRDEVGREVVEASGCRFSVCDVSDADAVQAWIDTEAETLGGVDVVVAGAGYELVADALELSVEDWDRHQAVMLRGVFVTFKFALSHMMSTGGSLIAIGSNLAFAAIPRFTSYVAAKAGVIGLVRGLAVDYAQYDIRVNALSPGPTLTPLIERQLIGAEDPQALLDLWASDTILKRLARPEEITGGAVFLASEDSTYVTGSSLMVDGGYTAL